MFIVLGALVGLGGAGYWYLKPVRDLAAKTNQAVDTVKTGAVSFHLFSWVEMS
jgi:hypothetical protein